MKKLISPILMCLLLTCLLLGSLLTGCNNEETTTASAPVTKTTDNSITTTTKGTTTTETAARQKEGGVLRIIGTEGPTGSLGIPKNWIGLAGTAVGPIIEGLYVTSADGTITYLLATDMQLSDDLNSMTLKLRKGVKFHDGTDFNATAVIWNWDQAMAAKMDGTENVVSYSIIDDYTVKLNFKEFQNAWIQKPGNHFGRMISPSWVEKMGEDYVNWHPCGTGPFKFKDYKENEYLEMERFNGYWGDRPYLDGIKLIFIADSMTAQIAFESGEGDVISVMSGGPKMAHDLSPKGFQINADPGGLCTSLIPSVTNPESPLANLKVREAIEYAIDKVKIAKNVGLDYYTALYQYAGSIESVFDSDFKGREYNPDKARELLAEAGYPDGFRTKLICGTHLAGDELPAIQANLKAVGIDIEIELVSVAKWIEMESNGWPEGLLESPTTLSTGYGTVLLRYLVKPNEPNWYRGLYWDSMYRPDELENLIQEYLVIHDEASAEAIAKGKEIVQLIYDQVIAIPLYESLGNGGIYIIQPWVHDRTLNVPPGSWNYTATWLSNK